MESGDKSGAVVIPGEGLGVTRNPLQGGFVLAQAPPLFPDHIQPVLLYLATLVFHSLQERVGRIILLVLPPAACHDPPPLKSQKPIVFIPLINTRRIGHIPIL
jgi:hypothetical protein